MNIKLAADELINLANSLSANEDVSPEEFKEKLVYTFEFPIVICYSYVGNYGKQICKERFIQIEIIQYIQMDI